ncbi:hypothetical protein Hbl1158_04505 [Halobaculum sp. CBA1158]|uniref:hypothetical protein n=1 Tax=Halobaculum sp. CBA1158 TaxID=2904243 RepID=UPI001F30CE08|nr:hypothetical protein [Halobaculum sp. CBA1158]UIP00628.1 hypothetical protein Hbl1158_04505 [Halobaculum sp. CBA1158]
MFRLWHDSERFARYIVENTDLAAHGADIETEHLPKSDAGDPREFHRVPDHIKEILYLDSPDLIVEANDEPLFTVEISEEAGTGHNAFQRFPRIAASVEASVPALYIYPEASFIVRTNSQDWDELNPLVFRALESAMQIHDEPALLFYYPTDFDGDGSPPTAASSQNGLRYDDEIAGQPERSDPEMQRLFEVIDVFVDRATGGSEREFIKNRTIRERRNWMHQEFASKGGPDRTWSPLTSTTTVPTDLVVEYLEEEDPDCTPELLERRDETVIYSANAKIRGDPYPGALAAIDYLETRIGESYRERDRNLVFCWGSVSVEDGSLSVSARSEEGSSVEAFLEEVNKVVSVDGRLLLGREYDDLRPHEIPRYYMQVRHGTRYTQRKLVRCYAYFADAILFHDGALWREG